MTDETTNTEQSHVAADCPNERLVMRDHFAELIYCLELARPHLPPPAPTPGPQQRSALAARIDNLLEDIYQKHGEELENEVRSCGA